MPEMKCQAALIAAIDAMDTLPSTREEKQALVDEWRDKERGLHKRKSEGEVCSRMITVEEIDSILRTQHIRLAEKTGRRQAKVSSSLPDGGPWQRVSKVHGPGCRNTPDAVSVTRAGQVSFPIAMVERRGLSGVSSVVLYRSGLKVRVEMLSTRTGDFIVSFADQRQVRCKRLIEAIGVTPGRYPMTVVKEKPFTVEIDFAARIGDLVYTGGRHGRRRDHAG